MAHDEIKSELSTLAKEIKEHVSFMEEIGVSHVGVKLDEPTVPATVKPVKAKPVVSQDRLEKFVPDKKIEIPTNLEKETAYGSKPKSRRRIFDEVKLSNLEAKRQPREVKSENIDTDLTKNMPAESKLKESIFGDITEALPESNETLEIIRAEIGADCNRCKLCEKRTQVVNSVGNPNADLMFIGEAPGADEDEQGEPFVGRAGQLLTKIIEAIDLTREEVFIGNINRCRPPENRQPQADEVEVCKPYLFREIAVVKPQVIVVMGNTACQNLLDTKVGITKLRGTFKDYFGVKVMPTFHPAYLLRDPRKKREVWEDMKTVRAYLDRS